MTTISGAGRETVLYVRALAAALVYARNSAPCMLDVRGVDEPSPAARKAAVTARLNVTLADLEAVIRSKKMPPTRISTAAAVRKVIELHDNYDAVDHTYTPGVGFRSLIEGLVFDELAGAETNIRRHVANN